MSIAPEILPLLRCPQTGQPLALAPASLLAGLEARRASGSLSVGSRLPQWDPHEPLEAVLIREDGQVGYLVQGGIPLLLPDHGVELAAPQ